MAAADTAAERPPLFRFLRALSYTNSCVFAVLLYFWLARDSQEPWTAILGWTHGCMWITLSILSLIAVRRRVIPFWLAVIVAVVGGIGPFVGSLGFAYQSSRPSRTRM